MDLPDAFEDQPPIDPNPYASPGAMPLVDASVGRTAPRYVLYSVGGIVLATFFGSLLATGFLMAIDYVRLGRRRSATIAAGLAITGQVAVLLCIVFVLPERMPKMPVTVLQLVLAGLVAEGFLGRKLTLHRRAGGRAVSLWPAAGIGLLCLVINLAATIAFALLKQAYTWQRV